MFSKRAVNPFPVAGSASALASVDLRALGSEALSKPAVSAGGAGLFFLLAAVAALLVAGDPSAGAPSVRIRLSQPGAPPPPPGWREALTPDAAGRVPISRERLQLLADGEPAASRDAPALGIDGAPTERAALALPRAPMAGLTAPGPGGGLLPIIAADGRGPLQAYARPFHSNGRPKIALVIGGLGLNAKSTRDAIEQLPADVTLSFAPYAEGLQSWIDLARANGHEALLEVPMEPKDYPDSDPGPYTLMATGKPPETLQRLDWLLSRATGYFGVSNYLGAKFIASDAAMTTFSAGLRRRGLAFVDDGSAAKRGGGLPRVSADRVIDDQLAGETIDNQLQALEASATRDGQALGAGLAHPVTLTEVVRWTQSLSQRGYQLAPASALLIRR
jgi:polysaccharide deacetylase 2 family uncharacterized protein YibQ